MTEWRKIPGLPDRFEASDDGRIRSIPYKVKVLRKDGTIRLRPVAGKELKPRSYEGGKSKGHPVVTISGRTVNGTKVGEQRISLLVARAFHGCPYAPGDQTGCQRWRVMHIDGDINNINADNLKWIGSNGNITSTLYEENVRRLAEEREDPLLWARRVFGNDLVLEDEEEATA